MFMIQIDRHDAPPSVHHECQFPASEDYAAARTILRFLVDNMQPGWRVSLVNGATNSTVVVAITQDESSEQSAGTSLLGRLGRPADE